MRFLASTLPIRMHWHILTQLKGFRITNQPLSSLNFKEQVQPETNPPPSPTAATRSSVSSERGGKKKVYLAQDTLLDREVAFALIKTEGLDEVSRTRITREA